MHRAMQIIGWRMPLFGEAVRHRRNGLIKYGVCSSLALFAGILASLAHPIAGMLVAPIVFYAVEAQSVFLFPEALLSQRAPWASSRRLTVSAGGTLRVMCQVLPLAVGMLTAGCLRAGWVRGWCTGCLAVLIWHRQVKLSERQWTEDRTKLPRLEIGPVNPILIRREIAAFPQSICFKAMWVSDLHWSGEKDSGCLMSLLEIARNERPKVVILGGDLVEGRRALALIRKLVGHLSGVAHCIVLPGNHDRRWLEDLTEITRSEGGHWLPEHSESRVQLPDGLQLLIDGGQGSANHPGPEARLVCLHDPAGIEQARTTGEPAIALAGHLHGGQWVMAERGRRLYPAAWVYPHAVERGQFRNFDLIVGRGLGDTFPVRWRCPREVVILELK